MLVNLPSPHPGALARPSTPEVLQARECIPTLSPSVVFTFELMVSSSMSLRVHHSMEKDYSHNANNLGGEEVEIG